MSSNEALLTLDLATLRTFRLVYRLGSFSAAAAEIDVKQSTVSYTIDRLRKVTGDPLFVRQAGRIVPTDRCRDIVPVVDRLLSEADNLVSDEFDPSTSTGEITIGCVDYPTWVLLPQVLARLRTEAQNVKVNLRSGYLEFFDQLFDGQIDIAIIAGGHDRNGLYSQNLISDDHAVCIMDKTHPLVGKRMTEEDLCRYDHMLALPFPNFKAAYIQEATERGLKLRTPVVIAGVVELPNYLEGTDMIAGMPSRFANKFKDKIGIAAFPFTALVDVNMFWTAASHRSKLNAWVRSVIIEEASKLPPPITV